MKNYFSPLPLRIYIYIYIIILHAIRRKKKKKEGKKSCKEKMKWILLVLDYKLKTLRIYKCLFINR